MNNTKYWIIGGGVLIVIIGIILGIWFLRSRNPFEGVQNAAYTSNPPSATGPASGAAKPSRDYLSDDVTSTAQDPAVIEKQYESFFGRKFGANATATASEPPVSPAPSGEGAVPVVSPPANADASTNAKDDPDGDGLANEQEATLGTDPSKPDTDGDGLTDGQEALTYKTNPLKPDSDGDGYPDGAEVKSGYNPLGPDKCARPTCIP